MSNKLANTFLLIALNVFLNSAYAFDEVTDLTSQWLAPIEGAPSYGSGGSARQGWINGLDGWFNEEWHLGFTGTDNYANSPNTFTGFAHVQKRLTRRIGVGIDLPFVTSTGDETSFGNMGIMLKAMLYETQDTSISGGFDTYFPTSNKNHQIGGNWRVSPHIDIYQDLGNAFSFQGGVIVDVLPQSNAKANTAVRTKLGFGRTMTEHDAVFGDLTPHLITTITTPVGGANSNVFVSLTPGIRTHMWGGYFLLGVEVPVTGSATFESRTTIMYIRGF